MSVICNYLNCNHIIIIEGLDLNKSFYCNIINKTVFTERDVQNNYMYYLDKNNPFYGECNFNMCPSASKLTILMKLKNI